MTVDSNDDADTGLILAAEECPLEKFEDYHSFSQYDDVIIRKLSAHGPVLIRGGRGSGKSALLIEAHRRMKASDSVFPVYMSLRYLALLKSDGAEYISHFCKLLSDTIITELTEQKLVIEFSKSDSEETLQHALHNLAQQLNKRIVILFDDAAHIGREKPLEDFFDLFRTLSSNTTSCKASIYPGVTKFGIRFDVFNDSTVIDINRSDVSKDGKYFVDVVSKRYARLSQKDSYSEGLTPEIFANLVGRSVVGNIRGFILACNRFDGIPKIGIPEVNTCLIDMATDYYWPLMEEVAPKLGVYKSLIDPSTNVFEAIVDHVIKPLSGSRIIAQDRVIIHRNIIRKLTKIFEILEYLGFVAKREASRGMKSGGRGPVYAINLCSLIEQVPSKRLTIDMISEWINGTPDMAEIHSSSTTFDSITLPALLPESALGILKMEIAKLAKSSTYPYGLTDDKINRLQNAKIMTVEDLANASDTDLMKIDQVGVMTVRRMRAVMQQAIWM